MPRKARGYWFIGPTPRRRGRRLVRWPRFTLYSTLIFLGVAGAMAFWVPSFPEVCQAMTLFAIVHAAFLHSVEPEPDGRA